MKKWRLDPWRIATVLQTMRGWLLLLCFPLWAFPQSPSSSPFSFQYLTTDDGLSQNTVDYIYKDSYGFMWFATGNGLCRYDGHKFRVLKATADDLGLPNNFVHALVEDQDRLLWIGTAKGLGVFDLAHDRFCQLDNPVQDHQSLIVRVLYKDREGNLFVGTENAGVFQLTSKQYDAESNTIQFSLERLGLQDITVEAVTQLDDRNLLLGTSQGLWRYDKKEKKLLAVTDIPLVGNTSSEILSLFFDKENGDIWIGTQLGLLKYNIWSGKSEVLLHDPENPSSISHNTVPAICKDVQGNILLGTLGGLNIYRPESGEILHISENADHHTGLNNKFVNSIFADPYANVWVGTDKGGVNKYNTYQNQFGAIVHDKGDPQSMSHPTVNSILVEKEVLWVGTAGGGLSMIDRSDHTAIKHFRHNPNDSKSLSSDFVTSIMRDRNGQLWLGTWGSGLNQLLSPQSGQFRRYLAEKAVTSSLTNDFISSLFEDPSGLMLVGTRAGLNVFDPQTKKIRELRLKDQADPGGVEVGCIWLDHTDHYWIGTRRQGLFRFPASLIRGGNGEALSGDVQNFHTDSPGTLSLPGNYIISLKEDDQGRLWIGTYGNGIVYCELEGEQALQFHYYDEKDGLCNNVVYCIEVDYSGALWLSTDFGLSRFEPETEAFNNYYEVDGLLSNQFYWSASCKDEQGRLYFGGVEGLNFFNPSDIDDFPFIPKASLTDMTVLNKPLEIGQKRNGKVALDKIITEADTVFLSYKDNVFSIEFSTLDYFLADKTQYAYKMQGVDQDWVTVPASRNYVSYTNLQGGEYTFQVKASNGNGVWQQQSTELTLIIRPPFWDTNWFRLMFVAILLVGIFGYIRWRTRYLNLQKKRLERLVGLRTQEIEAQKEQLKHQADDLKRTNLTLEERQRQIEGQKTELEVKNQEISQQRDQLEQLNQQIQMVNQLRLRFFTNISHEFRTPLTLIIDPLESLMDRLKGDQQSIGTLNIIHRNAQRLLHLINQLMNFRRVEEGKVDVRVTQGDLGAFVRHIYHSFSDLAEQQQVEYIFNFCGAEGEDTWFDAEKLENILYNLLSNAFKYTPEKGKIALNLKIESTGRNRKPSCFVLEVSDTGIGIAKEHLAHIFDHFYRIPVTENARIEGTGIGLSLTRELVESLHGTIELRSQVGQGTTFRVRIPYAKEAFHPAEICKEGTPRQFNLLTQVNLFREEVIARKRDQPKKEQVPKKTGKDKPVVLIVEDNYDLRSFLVQSLNPYYQILEADNGKEGLGLANKYLPHLVISDIMMPLMDGMELCSRLKSNIQTSHIPIILLTAKTMVENWVKGLETGADDYIPKPFNLKILRARIDNLIKSREQLRQVFKQEPAPSAVKVTNNSLDEEFVQKAYEILEENYRDSAFNAEEFASKMYISRSLLYKKIKALTGMSITDFVNSFKLKKSIEYLFNEDKNIAEIAFEVGFNDPKYFSRVFKKYFGLSPSDYVKEAHTNVSEQKSSS